MGGDPRAHDLSGSRPIDCPTGRAGRTLSLVPDLGSLGDCGGPDALEELVRSSAQIISAFFMDQLSNLLKNAFVLISDFLILLFTLWFLYKDGRRWFWFLFARLDITIRAVVKGVLLTAVVQGLLAGAAYAALGVPFAVVFTALTILLAPLPFGGTAFVWDPVVLYCAGRINGQGAGDVGVEGRRCVDGRSGPQTLAHRTGRSNACALSLVFSILGGLALYGLIGLFVGPILMSILMTVISIYREEYHAAPPSHVSSQPHI